MNEMLCGVVCKRWAGDPSPTYCVEFARHFHRSMCAMLEGSKLPSGLAEFVVHFGLRHDQVSLERFPKVHPKEFLWFVKRSQNGEALWIFCNQFLRWLLRCDYPQDLWAELYSVWLLRFPERKFDPDGGKTRDLLVDWAKDRRWDFLYMNTHRWSKLFETYFWSSWVTTQAFTELVLDVHSCGARPPTDWLRQFAWDGQVEKYAIFVANFPWSDLSLILALVDILDHKYQEASKCIDPILKNPSCRPSAWNNAAIRTARSKLLGDVVSLIESHPRYEPSPP